MRDLIKRPVLFEKIIAKTRARSRRFLLVGNYFVFFFFSLFSIFFFFFSRSLESLPLFSISDCPRQRFNEFICDFSFDRGTSNALRKRLKCFSIENYPRNDSWSTVRFLFHHIYFYSLKILHAGSTVRFWKDGGCYRGKRNTQLKCFLIENYQKLFTEYSLFLSLSLFTLTPSKLYTLEVLCVFRKMVDATKTKNTQPKYFSIENYPRNDSQVTVSFLIYYYLPLLPQNYTN